MNGHLLFPQPLLDLHDELIIDLFAGGGGASSGIEQGLGRPVDVAINHDAAAIELHKANHPQTLHLRSDVFEVCPKQVCEGRPVGLLWASPDCTYHSKARGGKPIRDKNRKRRALAWVVTRWAGQVRPRVIMLENVEEFANWGPLVGPPDALRPCPRRRGRTFRRWVKTLRNLGYTVEWRELRACDYGAPTIRKRLFLIARCDGKPIVWPEPTHGPGRAKPYRTAAECIDWSIPMLSIFATKEEAKAWGKHHGQAAPIRPLAENTQRRIARGVKKYVLDNPKPFLVRVAHGEQSASGKRWGRGEHPLDEPVGALACSKDLALVSPFMVPRYGEREGQEPRCRSVEHPAPVVVPAGNGGSLVAANLGTYYGDCDRVGHLAEPLRTQSTENRHALVASFMAKHYGGNETPGAPLDESAPTLTTKGPHEAVVAAHIQRDFGTGVGHSLSDPARTATTEGGGKSALVASFLAKYYGTGDGQEMTEPVHTIPTVDRFGLVTVHIGGQTYVVEDIAMRMLQPRELYRAQGFRDGYAIDKGADGRILTKSEQVRMCGNSVCPPVAEALVRANASELIARPEKGPTRSKSAAMAMEVTR